MATESSSSLKGAVKARMLLQSLAPHKVQVLLCLRQPLLNDACPVSYTHLTLPTIYSV